MMRVHQPGRLLIVYSSDLERLVHTPNRLHRFEGDVSLKLASFNNPLLHTATDKELRLKQSVADE